MCKVAPGNTSGPSIFCLRNNFVTAAPGRNFAGNDEATSASEYPGRAATMKSHSPSRASASCHLAMSLNASMPIRKYRWSLLPSVAFTRRTVSIE